MSIHTGRHQVARSGRRAGRLIGRASLALLSTATLAAAVVAGAGPAGADVSGVAGNAWGISLSVVGTSTFLVPETPYVALPGSATVSQGVSVPGVVSVALPTVSSKETGGTLPSPTAAAVTSADAADIQIVPGLLGGAPLVDINAIDISCRAGATGSTAAISAITISIAGGKPQKIQNIEPNTFPNLNIPTINIPGIGNVTPVIELDRQQVINEAGLTGITADGLYVSLGGIAILDVGHVFCEASGPDVEAPPSVSGLTPRHGPVKGGTAVTIHGSDFTTAKSVTFGGVPATHVHVVSSTEVTAVSPKHSQGPVDVRVISKFGKSGTGSGDVFTYTAAKPPPPPPPPPHKGLKEGYWLVASDGGIFTFGHAHFYGSAGSIKLKAPIVAMTPARKGTGYWLIATDGGVFSFGSSHFYGSTGSKKLNKPIVGMAATPDGKGYWLVASDGGIFAFGDASFHGSTGSLHLNKPIVGMAPTLDGKGYWLVASDGGIFAFGDARFFGAKGGGHLNAPIVGMAVRPQGDGYWLVASDGGIFTFGPAPYLGSAGSIRLNKPIVGMASSPDGRGYWLDASDGGIFTYGDAHFFGSTGNKKLNAPMVGMAPSFTS